MLTRAGAVKLLDFGIAKMSGSPLIAVPNLHNVIDTLPADEQFTHIFDGEQNQLDYLLVSKPLKNALQSVTVERRGMFKFPGHFPSITKDSQEASDHAAVGRNEPLTHSWCCFYETQ